MKQRFLLVLIFACSFMVNTKAQISKGAGWLGGTIGYNQNKTDFKDTAQKDYKTSTFNFSPSIGVAVKDNLIVGIKLSYGVDKSKNNANILESETNSYGGGIFVRQYIPVISRLYLFGDASANFSSSKGNTTVTDFSNVNAKLKTTSKGWSTWLNVTPGLAFAITKKFQVETSLNSLFNVGYTKIKFTTDKPSTNYGSIKSTDAFNAGIFSDGKVQLNIGCRFLL